jgi:hypothetical protein
MFGIQRVGLLIGVHCRGVVFEATVEVAQSAPRNGPFPVVVQQFQTATIKLDGRLVAALLHAGQGQVAVGPAVRGVELDRAMIGVAGLIVRAGHEIQVAQFVPQLMLAHRGLRVQAA